MWRIVYKSNRNRVLLLTDTEESCNKFLYENNHDPSLYIVEPTGGNTI